MFKYLLIISLFLFQGLLSTAQGLISGRITFQNENNKPVPRAFIRSDVGGGRAYSDSKGEFHIKIAGKRAGNEVSLMIMKDGYEVVNKKDLFVTIKKDPSRLLEFYMCPEGEWHENSLKYYAINEKLIQNKYTTLIRSLYAQISDGALLNKKINELEIEKRVALKEAENLSLEFAKANLSTASQAYRDAYQQFVKGNLDAALTALKRDVSLNKIKREWEGIKNLRKLLLVKDSLINRHGKNILLQARLFMANLELDSAKHYYRTVFSLDSTNYEYGFAYTWFLHKSQRFDDALKGYEYLLKLNLDPIQSSRVYLNLGILYRQKNKFIKSIALSCKAIQTRKKVSKGFSELHLPIIAKAYNNMGVTYSDWGKYKLAMESHSTALKIYDTLKVKRVKYLEKEFVFTLSNLGVALINLKQNSNGISKLKRAKEISGRINSVSSNSDKNTIAGIFNNIGIAYFNLTEYDSALVAFVNALKIREELEKQSPSVYMSDIGKVYNNVGRVYAKKEDYEKAIIAYHKAAEKFEKLSQNQSNYLREWLYVLQNLGDSFIKVQNFEKGEQAFKKAIELARRLTSQNKDIFLIELLTSLNGLGKLYHRQGNFQMAESYFKKATSLEESGIGKYQSVLSPQLAISYGYLTKIYKENRNIPKKLFASQKEFFLRMKIASETLEISNIDLAKLSFSISLDYLSMPQFNIQKTVYFSEKTDSLLILSKESSAKNRLEHLQNSLFNPTSFLKRVKSNIDNSDSWKIKKRLQYELVLFLERKFPLELESIDSKRILAKEYGTLSKYLLFINEYSEAEFFAMRGLELDPTQIEIYSKLMCSLIYRGYYKKFKFFYRRNIPNKKNKASLNILLDDLEELADVGITHPKIKKIRRWIRAKVK